MPTIVPPRFWFLTVLAAGVCLALSACGGGSPSSESSTPAPAKSSSGGYSNASESSEVNIDAIFPAGPGRDLTLNNCVSCHTFVPIVVLQMDKQQWTRNMKEHRERVEGLSDEEFKTLYDYLMASFNPDRPIPKLPKQLLDTWTSY